MHFVCNVLLLNLRLVYLHHAAEQDCGEVPPSRTSACPCRNCTWRRRVCRDHCVVCCTTGTPLPPPQETHHCSNCLCLPRHPGHCPSRTCGSPVSRRRRCNTRDRPFWCEESWAPWPTRTQNWVHHSWRSARCCRQTSLTCVADSCSSCSLTQTWVCGRRIRTCCVSFAQWRARTACL